MVLVARKGPTLCQRFTTTTTIARISARVTLQDPEVNESIEQQ
ncbi:hypothetical protein O3597_25940 [Verrucosispora sp. WMMA2044]|nr:hypothetical protein [Verrucosispora sp. WMMA2044]WBB48483.1 hypothetical protein O3597_25940 [Verrucosispora sp. WMMA2044]